ncbi:2-thiouracil desulfurase family protein, partial [Klebsiella pneumoniae]
MKELWLVSACLLGDDCKYNGGNNFSEKVVDFLRDKDYIRVCPEVAGGLP